MVLPVFSLGLVNINLLFIILSRFYISFEPLFLPLVSLSVLFLLALDLGDRQELLFVLQEDINYP